MTLPTLGMPLSVDKSTVAAWIASGRRLDEIDADLLQPAMLTDEQHATLWLYAWGEVSRRERAQAGRDRVDRRRW